jgi:RNA polymerase sigma-70 factor, ECF subfamily
MVTPQSHQPSEHRTPAGEPVHRAYPPARQREEFIRSLHETHGRALLAFALSELQGDRQAAEDIVQETMIRAWQHADSAGLRGAPRAWLFTTAHRLVIDRWRRISVRPQEVANVPLHHVEVRDHADTALSGLVVKEALSALTDKYRAVIVQVYLHGRTANETAAVLDIPVGTVKSRLHNAVRALRAVLEAKGATEVD